MASGITFEDFEGWLSSKLKSLGTDEGVFGSYITGILSGEETIEEKTEALEGILSEISASDITNLCTEILDKWKEYWGEGGEKSGAPEKPAEDVEEKLVRLLEKNTLTTPVQRKYTEEERKIREAILSQYAETSDQEADDEEAVEESGGSGGGGGGLVKNTNASSVAQAEREKREKAKVDSQKKKEKDKEDRERQKQQAAEKKEKRKTQKGERRR